MKIKIIILLLCILSLSSYGQFNKTLVLSTNANFYFLTRGTALNDAGFGMGLNASLFSKNKLQLLLETSADRFVGDKLFILDAEGRENKAAVIYSMKVGGRLFISRRFAFSILYGPSWHSIRSAGFTRDDGYKFGITGFLGRNRRLIGNLCLQHIMNDNQPIQYFGLGLGYRFD